MVVELDPARLHGIESVIATPVDILSRVPFEASLSDDDLAWQDVLAYTNQLGLGSYSCYAPPNFFTPNLLPAESEPFFDDPPPRFVDVRIWT